MLRRKLTTCLDLCFVLNEAVYVCATEIRVWLRLIQDVCAVESSNDSL